MLTAAENIFAGRADTARVRWIQLERRGYGEATATADLHALFGESPPVLAAVRRSRVRSGRVMIGGVVRHWPHFFCESVAELRLWARKLEGGESEEITLQLAGTPNTPNLAFDRDVFADVLTCIAIEIADAIRLVAA